MTEAQNNEIIIAITEDEYLAERARGFEEDEVLPAGIHTFRRGGFLQRHALDPKQMHGPVQVRVTLDLDLDIVTYFQQRAEHFRGVSYQNQINTVLRKVMEQAQ